MKNFILALVLLTGCDVPASEPVKPAPPKPVIYAFHADWCSYCPRMYPTWRRFEKRNYDVRWINTDNSNVDEKYGVRTLPSTVVVKNGKAVIFSGVTSYETIDKYLRE